MYHFLFFVTFLSGLFFVANPVYGQEDSLSEQKGNSVHAFYAAGGPIFAFGPVYFHGTGEVIFRGGWGAGADFVRDKYGVGELGADISGSLSKRNLTTLRVIRQFYLPNDKWQLQMGLGPSFGNYKNSFWQEHVEGRTEMWDDNGKSFGLGGKINLTYRLNQFVGIRGGAYLGFNYAFHLSGPEVSLLVGNLGVRSDARVNRPLDSYTSEELAVLEKRTRNYGRAGVIIGGVLTGLAIGTNVIAVADYHKNDAWSKLGGTVGLAISHLGFAPAGTGLLIWGFNRRGKANIIRNKMEEKTGY